MVVDVLGGHFHLKYYPFNKFNRSITSSVRKSSTWFTCKQEHEAHSLLLCVLFVALGLVVGGAIWEGEGGVDKQFVHYSESFGISLSKRIGNALFL